VGRGHPDEVIIRISEAKGNPKRQKKKKLTMQINVKFNDISSGNVNK
jgi:hypothetical protein